MQEYNVAKIKAIDDLLSKGQAVFPLAFNVQSDYEAALQTIDATAGGVYDQRTISDEL